MATSRLSTTRWVPPGAYLGRKFVPRPAVGGTNFNKLALIGRGNRLKSMRDVEIKRSYVFNETLNFVGPPYKATTQYKSNLDKISALLTKSNGEPIPVSRWEFVAESNNTTSVQIDNSVFSAEETYLLSYQSVDRNVKDPIPWYPSAQMRSFLGAGSVAGADEYREGVDFKIDIARGAPVRVDAGAGDPGFAWHGDALYTAKDTRTITFEVTAVSPAQAAATRTIGTGSAALTFTAKATGAGGNSITVTMDGTGLDQTLDVTVSGTDIIIQLATDGAGVVTSTATAVAAAVTADPQASLLITCTAGGDGSGLPAEQSQSALQNGGPAVTGATISYSSSTQEGGFGTVDLVETGTEPTFAKWWVTVPTDPTKTLVKDGMAFEFSAPNNLAVGQKWTVTITNEHKINWSLVQAVSDTFSATQVLTDRIGVVTGTPGARYIILTKTPTDTSVTVTAANAAVITPVVQTDVNGNPTVNVKLTGYTGGAVTAAYSWRGAEPNPGDTYYFSAYVLRPDADYNTVINLNSPDEVAAHLAPMTADNDLFIMAQMAADLGAKVAVVQVADGDYDGVYTDADFKAGIDAAYADKTITDVCVLGKYTSMGYAKQKVVEANDSFYRGWRLLWNGMPVNAAIGNESVPDSVVYTATKALAIYGDSQGRGSQILVANRWAKRALKLDNGSTQVVVLDGSFIAGALAALSCSFNNPYETLLRREVNVFSDIETFTDAQIAVVGAASTVYLFKEGSTIRIGESVTVDNTEAALNEISGRKQEHYVNRYICDQVDKQLVSMTPDSIDDGIALTQSFVGDALLSLRSRGFIGQWTNAQGSSRPFDPNEDVQAAADQDDPRIYFFNYWYNLRFPGKRFQGLYSVGRNAFKTA